MWQKYLAVAFRLMARHRAHTLIGIGGLAIGLAGCLLILSYVRYERSYDRWVPGSERIYQVQATWHEPGQPVSASQSSPFPIRETLAGGFPQIEALTVARSGRMPLMRDGQPTYMDTLTVDPSFLDIFPLEFVRGSRAGALAGTRSVVLSETEAVRQFGTIDAIGRTITASVGDDREDFSVSGVIRDLPRNTSLRIASLFRFDPSDWDDVPAAYKGWGSMGQAHWVKLKPGADAAAINAQLPAWEKRTVAPQIVDGRPMSQADIMDLKLVPIADVHLGEAQQSAQAPGGDPRVLAAFMVVAALTLGMAMMNFVNLSTARATLRAREVSLRKVLGASRGQLIAQFLIESSLAAGIAMLIALTIVELAAPWLGAWIDGDLAITYLGEGGILLPALGLLALTGIVGGLYPALYLSRFQPALVLRANKSSAETPGNGRLRTALVVVQFAIAIGLIVCTTIIYAQTRYVETVDPGFRRDGLIQVRGAGRLAAEGNFEAARNEMARVPGVAAVGRSNLGIAATNKSIQLVQKAGESEGLSIGSYRTDADFFRTMDIRLIAGRMLGDRYANDRIPAPAGSDPAAAAAAEAQLIARGANIVVNRNAAALLGYARPEDAIGQSMRVSLTGDGMTPVTIVGVVEDTRIRTARDAIEPLIYTYDPDRTNQLLVRYQAARPSEVMAGLRAVWARFVPGAPFEGEFAEDIVRAIYAADRARAAMFAGFAVLAVLIACLGLYSLASFTTERRTKEIGIRKVLGAKVRDIVRLLAWQFSKPVVLANLVAWPVAWWAMREWLNGFDLRMPLGPGPFAAASLAALAIALATVAGQSFRVARKSPIHALRYE